MWTQDMIDGLVKENESLQNQVGEMRDLLLSVNHAMTITGTRRPMDGLFRTIEKYLRDNEKQVEKKTVSAPCVSEFQGNKCSLKATHVPKGIQHMFLHYQTEAGGIRWPLTPEESGKREGDKCPACGKGVTGQDALCEKHYGEYLGTNRARGNNEND